jgi:exopolysaccharide biosynthesis polyprenyl glycosylphosphotransferase
MYIGTTRTPIFAGPDADAPVIKFLPFWTVRPRALVLGAEAGLLGAIFAGAVLSTIRSNSVADTSVGVVLGVAGGQVVLHLAGVGRSIADPNPMGFFRGIFGSLLMGLLLTAVLTAAFPAFSRGYTGGLLAWFAAVGFVVALRPILRSLIRRHRLIQTLMILGPNEMAEKLYGELASCEAAVQHAETSGDLELDINQDRISRIVVADPSRTSKRDLDALIDSRMRGLKVEQAVESCETMCRKIWIEGLEPEWWIYSDGFVPTRPCRFLKHTLDILGAVFLLITTWPLLVLSAIAIKLTSEGPVFYQQERVGLHGRIFMVLKFRSMHADAEAKTGPQWASENDGRITRIGAILRKFRIDELPQLFNVLKGDMSFVGPRPERPYFVERLKQDIPYYDVRHYVRPGITGWAQVKHSYGASVADSYQKLQYDLYYQKHMSLLLDLTIVFKTMRVVFAGRGR